MTSTKKKNPIWRYIFITVITFNLYGLMLLFLLKPALANNISISYIVAINAIIDLIIVFIYVITQHPEGEAKKRSNLALLIISLILILSFVRFYLFNVVCPSTC